MILISLRPYPLKKIFLIVAGLIALSSVSCFADSLFLSMSLRPHHKQMTRIGAVAFSEAHPQNRPLAGMNYRVEDVRAVPYGLSSEWTTDQGTYVLDPATNGAACQANQLEKLVDVLPYAYTSTVAFCAEN